MQEVRVESLDGLEMSGGQMRLSANSGSLSIVFPKEVWDHILASAPAAEEPDAVELGELAELKGQLKAFAEEHSFKTIREAVRCGEFAIEYDLVLRPAGLFAVTTGYHFAPVVDRDLMEKLGACLGDVPGPKGRALELDAEYSLHLAALVLVRGHEDGPHHER